MSDLDETALAIGQIQATLKSHGDAHIMIISGINQINDKLTQLNGSVKKAHERIDEAAPALEAANDYGEKKKQAKWWIAGMSVTGLGGGFSVTAWLDGIRDLIAGQ
jgi:hypothetical protein